MQVHGPGHVCTEARGGGHGSSLSPLWFFKTGSFIEMELG